MLNTRDLENRWFKYKIKSYIPYIIITLSSVIIILVISIFMNSDKEDITVTLVDKQETETEPQQKFVNQKEKTINIKILEDTAEVKEKVINEVSVPIKATVENDKSLKLSPSLDFIKKMQHSSLPYYNNEPTIQQEVKTVKKDPVEQIVEEIQDLTVNETIEVKEEEVKKVTINRRNVAEDIKHIIKRFKKNNNPALSLFVAKKYYELGDYHKAYNYALITNQINRDIDASWIVFSKSLVKLNEKDMAIKTLKEYIENSHSSSAKILLDEIVSGKFK